MKIERHNDRGFLSDAIALGDLIWVAGTVSDPSLKTVQDQTRDVLREVDRRLAVFHSRREQLLSVNIWLSRIEDWGAMNAIWLEWLAGAPSPTRVVVQSHLMAPFVIEIAAVACRSASI